MEFLHCPFCTKFVVISRSYEEILQKTMCKKCFKVFYVGFDETGLKTYREDQVIVNKLNNTVILKSSIDKELTPKMQKAFHDLNKKLTEKAEKEKQHAKD